MKKNALLWFLFAIICVSTNRAQVSYGSVATYGLRKLITTYTSSAIQVHRACDNATANIGFTSCGDLDTTALKNFVLVPNPLSAITATSAAAFSLRKLSCTYTNSAIQVRRSSDNTTLDIGFTALGDLDTVTMKAFIGANSAFVSIWYDQSGNARDASQATAAMQPRIMNAGVVEYKNNKPSIRFLGTTCGLATANFTAFSSAVCFNGVAKVNANLTYNTFASKTGIGGNNNFPGPIDFYNNNNITGNGVTATFFAMSQTFNAAQAMGIWTFQNQLATSNASLNSSSIVAGGAAANYTDVGQPINIGRRNDGVTGLDGWLSELITFGVIPSSTDMKYLEWTQGQYYNIAGPTLGTLPAGAQSASVATWYDQSGAGANASPTVTTNQPLIVSGGMVQRNSTLIPSIKFNGAQKGLVANLPVAAYPITMSAIASTSAVATNGAFVKLGGLDNVNNGTSGVGIGVGAAGGNFDPPTGNSLIGLKEWLLWCPSNPVVSYPTTPFAVELFQLAAGTMSAYLNGTVVPLTNSATAVGASITGSLYIGGYRNATDRYPSFKETEVTIFNSQLNNTRRILLETNQAAYHTITISANKYTPPSATTYNRFVLGVGRESATDSVCSTRESAGMGFTLSTNAAAYLKDNGDYITAGINCPITSSTNVTFISAPILLRWDNDWYVNKTDIVGTAGGTLSVYFDFGDYFIGTSPGAAANYSLLNRPTTASNFTVISGATANVSGDRVYFTVDANNLPTNSYYTIGTKNPPVSPLPIELLNFDATVCQKDVCLDWSTANEVNTDYFSIERSTDAQNFSEIKRVKAAGNSQRTLNYSAMDYEPLPGISYYRLKQVDINQNFTYTKIDAVEFKNELAVGIYPNPSTGELSISNCKNYDKLYVADLLGRTVYSSDVSKESMNLDLNSLPIGQYFITLTNSTTKNKFTSKIVIDRKQ